MPQLRVNSAGPPHPRPHGSPQRWSVLSYRMCPYWFRDALTPSPTETAFRSYITFQEPRYPLRPARFSVYASSLLFAGDFPGSARDATLDTGGWLARTRQGLSPCKAHQASLGALTPAITWLWAAPHDGQPSVNDHQTFMREVYVEIDNSGPKSRALLCSASLFSYKTTFLQIFVFP